MSRTAKPLATFTVTCRWDEAARVWYVDESDVPGLATEATTFEQLEQKLVVMIPELLELNLPDGPPEEIAFNLTAHKHALTRSA